MVKLHQKKQNPNLWVRILLFLIHQRPWLCLPAKSCIIEPPKISDLGSKGYERYGDETNHVHSPYTRREAGALSVAVPSGFPAKSDAGRRGPVGQQQNGEYERFLI